MYVLVFTVQKVEYMKLFKNQIQVYQNTKKRPVLLILSGLLSELSAGGITSRYNKSEDALILTVPPKYSDFWKCLLVNAAVYYSLNSLKKKIKKKQ